MRALIVALYRCRLIGLHLGIWILVVVAVAGPLIADLAGRSAVLALAGLAVAAILSGCLLVGFGARALPDPATVVLTPPVRGRWLGMNSPATKVPSHGLRAYGQAYAIDLVHEPTDGSRPAFGEGPAMRRSQDYPAFGQPVFAVMDGVVVHASDGRRDHLARSHWLGYFYLMLEGAVRELGGPGFIVGNHVTIQGAPGVFAMLAHLEQGSIQVRAGQRVSAGEVIGRCGNSGNSSEPHVHAQVMDRRWLAIAQGIPMSFAAITLDDATGPVTALPADGQHLRA